MESGTIEQSLPGLEGTRAPTAPQLAVGRAVSLTPQKRLAVVAGSSHPELADEDRRPPRRRADEGRARDLRGRLALLPLRGLRSRRRHVHRPDGGAVDRRASDGAADHGQRCQARLREADHGRHPLVLLRAPGQEVAAARADHRAPRRRPARDRRRRPRDHDGPARRPGAGLLPDPRRPHGRRADVRPAHPRLPRHRGRARRRRPGHGPREARGQVRGDDRRRPRRPEQGAPGPQPGEGDRRDRRRRGQGRRHDRRHHRHRRDAVRRRRGAARGRARPE